MPAGEVSSLRVMAARSGGLATELRRVATALSGCAGSLEWWGQAQQGFAGSVAAQLPELGRVADRYEQYAAAIIGYAVVLDRVQPQLVSLRRQLAAGYAEVPAVAPAALSARPASGWPGSGCASSGQLVDGDDARLRALARDFDEAWDQWQRALGRCAHALSRAGSVYADRHGWSAFGHNLLHVLGAVSSPVLGFVEHPGLAQLSRALGSLSDDLAFLGLALLVVCPPAAAVCFSAAAVASAVKLATDSTRAARGDHGVDIASLGMDALGALPGARLFKAGRDGVQATKALEELAEHERSIRLVPGGGLMAHESRPGLADKGHTLQRHVGKSEGALRMRLTVEPQISYSSTFYDRATAENAISDILTAQQDKIDIWLRGSEARLVLTDQAAQPVGVSIPRGGEPMHVSGVKVVLRRDHPTSVGYRIHTGFPQP